MKACEISLGVLFKPVIKEEQQWRRKMEQAGAKQKVFVVQFSKPSLRVARGNNRPDTGPLFLGGYKYKRPNVSVVYSFWLSAFIASQKIGDQR